MRLTGIREGDIVEVNDGIPYLAMVRGRRGRRLLVDPSGAISTRRRCGRPTWWDAGVGSAGRGRQAWESRMGGALLTAAEVAEILGVSPARVYAQSRAGRIPTVRLGRYRRYRRAAIDAWLAEQERGQQGARVSMVAPSSRR